MVSEPSDTIIVCWSVLQSSNMKWTQKVIVTNGIVTYRLGLGQ